MTADCTQPTSVWIFSGAQANFPSGVFHTREQAQQWIERHGLTGTLTEYPVGEGVYEWAIAKGAFEPKRPEHHQARFIERFSSASLAHEHYEDGRR